MTLEERITAMEQKLACLERNLQDRPAEETDTKRLTVDVSVLAHEIVAVANDLHTGNRNLCIYSMLEAKRHLTAAKEAMLTSSENPE